MRVKRVLTRIFRLEGFFFVAFSSKNIVVENNYTFETDRIHNAFVAVVKRFSDWLILLLVKNNLQDVEMDFIFCKAKIFSEISS